VITGGERIDAALATVVGADLLIVASPTYKASYTGLLKAFVDRLPPRALLGRAALPLMVTGSPAATPTTSPSTSSVPGSARSPRGSPRRASTVSPPRRPGDPARAVCRYWTVVTQLVCAQLSTRPIGDHHLVLGTVVAVAHGPDDAGLVHRDGALVPVASSITQAS